MKWSEVKVAQSCPILCNPMDYRVHGFLQARIQEWVAFPFFRGSSQPRDQTQVSRIAGRLFTSWTTREAQSGQWYTCFCPKVCSLSAYILIRNTEQTLATSTELHQNIWETRFTHSWGLCQLSLLQGQKPEMEQGSLSEAKQKQQNTKLQCFTNTCGCIDRWGGLIYLSSNEALGCKNTVCVAWSNCWSIWEYYVSN